VNIVISPRAASDLDRLRAFLAEESFQAAQRAVDRLHAGLRLLQDFPGLGRPLAQIGLRELILPFGKSAYVVHYRHSADRVVVLRIWHGRELRD
jgi:plasmid stabilization system protein ParE